MFEPAPNSNCHICNGYGFSLSTRGEFALATACSCIPTCSLCNGKGTRTILINNERRTGRCRCQKIHDRILLFNNACIPASQGSNTFQNFKKVSKGTILADKSCKTWLQKYISEPEKRGLILSGQVGRGKTHLLISIIRSLIFEQGERVRFIEFSRLLATLRDGFSKGQSNQELMHDLCTVPVLAIDELGKGRLTGWELSVIDDIISGRYNAQGIILATTNYKWGPPSGKHDTVNLAENFEAQSLGDRVGERVFSRLQEMCYFAPIQGDDFRAKKTQRLL